MRGDKYIPGTIIVTFLDGMAESTAKEILSEQSLAGTRVSSCNMKYAIDVPPNKEKHFQEYFEKHRLVKNVSDSFIKGKHFTPKPRPPKETKGR